MIKLAEIPTLLVRDGREERMQNAIMLMDENTPWEIHFTFGRNVTWCVSRDDLARGLKMHVGVGGSLSMHPHGDRMMMRFDDNKDMCMVVSMPIGVLSEGLKSSYESVSRNTEQKRVALFVDKWISQPLHE